MYARGRRWQAESRLNRLGASVARTRVLIGQGPPILQAIIRDIVGAARDMKLAGMAPARHSADGPAAREWLSMAVARIRPDVVLVGRNEDDSGEYWRRLVARHASMRIVAVEPGGRDVVVFEVGVEPAHIGEASEPVLLSAIRAPRADPGGLGPSWS